MNPSPDVYLLRHGETVWNKAGRIQGQMNSDLTDLGREVLRHYRNLEQLLHLQGAGDLAALQALMRRPD